MEYGVVQSEKLSELVDEVRQKIAEGWVTQGGVSVEMIPVEVENEDGLDVYRPNEVAYLNPQDEVSFSNMEDSGSYVDDIDSTYENDYVEDDGDGDTSSFDAEDDHGYEDEFHSAYLEQDEEDLEEEEEEVESYTNIIYLKRYVQVIVRSSKWNRKFSLNSASAASPFSRVANVVDEKIMAYMQSRRKPVTEDYYQDVADAHYRSDRFQESRPRRRSYTLTRSVSTRGRTVPSTRGREERIQSMDMSERRKARLRTHSSPMEQSPVSSSRSSMERWKGQGGYADHNPYASESTGHQPTKSPLHSTVTEGSEATVQSPQSVKKVSKISDALKRNHGNGRFLGRGRNTDKRYRQQVNPRNR